MVNQNIFCPNSEDTINLWPSEVESGAAGLRAAAGARGEVEVRKMWGAR